MKKLLIMSMALFFSIPIFAQTKTVKSNSAAVDEIKQKFNAVKNEAAEVIKKETGTKNGRVTRPGKDKLDGPRTLTLLDDNDKTGSRTTVTRPSGGRTTTTVSLQNPNRSVNRTNVTRPSGGSKSETMWDTLIDDKPSNKTSVTRRGGTRRR